MSRQSQMAGKMGQVCCREDLDRVGAQVLSWIFKLLKDRSIGVSVIVEDVPENCGQLVNLTWNRCRADIGCEDLTWVGGQVGLVRFNLLKDRCICFSVIAENVIQDACQVVDGLSG